MALTFDNGCPWRNQQDFNTTGPSDITGWASAGGYGTGNRVQSSLTKDRVLAVSTTSSVNGANLTAGVIGSWGGYNPPDLAATLKDSCLISTKNRLYLLGGNNSSSVKVTTVYTATVNADGTINAWSTYANSLNVARCYAQAVVTKNRVYLLGGLDGGSNNSVAYANIDADGLLGAWSAAGFTLPAASYDAQAVRIKDKVYLIGGTTGTVQATVYVATIATDGSLGSFSNTNNDLPGPLKSSQAVVISNKIFLLGGDAGSGAVATVYTASIDGSGVIGTWGTGTSLPATKSLGAAFITGSKIYLIGGSSSNDFSADFSGGLNDYLDKSYTVSSLGIEVDLDAPIPEIVADLAASSVINGSFNTPPVQILAELSTTIFMDAQFVAPKPRMEMFVNQGFYLYAPAPEITAVMDNPIHSSGSFRVPSLGVDWSKYSFAHFEALPPAVHAVTSNPARVSGALKPTVSQIAAQVTVTTPVVTEHLDGGYDLPLLRISGHGEQPGITFGAMNLPLFSMAGTGHQEFHATGAIMLQLFAIKGSVRGSTTEIDLLEYERDVAVSAPNQSTTSTILQFER